MAPLQPYNGVPAVAAYLGVSDETIYRLCAHNPPLLGYVRIGTGRGRIRIRREDVDAFLTEHTHRAGAVRR